MITLLSWVGVVLVLAAYASRRPNAFHWANVLLCVPICLPAILAGVWPSVFISMAFGIIAGTTLIRNRSTIYTEPKE